MRNIHRAKRIAPSYKVGVSGCRRPVVLKPRCQTTGCSRQGALCRAQPTVLEVLLAAKAKFYLLPIFLSLGSGLGFQGRACTCERVEPKRLCQQCAFKVWMLSLWIWMFSCSRQGNVQSPQCFVLAAGGPDSENSGNSVQQGITFGCGSGPPRSNADNLIASAPLVA